MKKFLLSIFIIAIILSFCPIYSEDSTDKIAPNEEFYKKIDEFIKDGIKEANADPEKGRYDFIVALSTSHFSSDTQKGIAMNQAAYLIANNICTAGDSVSSVYWELDVWKKSEKIILSEDSAERKQLVNLLPQAPKDDTIGGHDTFKSLISILKDIENPESSIIILMTNSYESQGPKGPNGKEYTVKGKDSKELKSLLEEKGFKTPKSESFDFFFENNDKPTTIYLTLVLPKELKSINGNTEDRYPISTETPVSTETPIPTETPISTETPIQDSQKDGFPIIPIIGVIILIIIAFIAMNKKKNSEDITKDKNTHELQLKFADENYKQEIEEEKIYEMISSNGSFKMRLKPEKDQDEEDDDNEDRDVKSVFEVSYSNKDFIFKFTNGSILEEDPEDLVNIKILDNREKTYQISCEQSGRATVNFENEDYKLKINFQ